MISEYLHAHQREQDTQNDQKLADTDSVPGEAELIYAAIDASVKNHAMGGHVMIIEEFQEHRNEFSIGTNRWTSSVYMSEACTMLELYKTLNTPTYNKSNKELIVITDNLRL